MTEHNTWNMNILQLLPPDILEYTLSSFCNGKALSSLFEAAVSAKRNCMSTIITSTDNEHLPLMDWKTVAVMISRILRAKLCDIVTLVVDLAQQKCDQPSESKQLYEASRWIQSVTNSSSCKVGSSDTRLEECIQSTVRYVSDMALVLDFLSTSLRDYSNVSQGHLTWPVWCGRITLDTFAMGHRVQHSARVVMLVPWQAPCWIPGTDLLHRATLMASFRCEPYRMIPRPPWGRIVPVHVDDDCSLKLMVQYMNEVDQVAVSAIHHYSALEDNDILNVRLLTLSQARSILTNRRGRLSSTSTGTWISSLSSTSSHWMLQTSGSQDSLLACWRAKQDVCTDAIHIFLEFT
jgi:hypothetical protein